MWRETADDWSRALMQEEDQAAQRLIKVPWHNGQLAELTRADLEEDSPDLHRAFQALTRLAEPNVSVICLESTEALGFSSAFEARRLLRRALRVTDRRVVFALLETSVPPAWSRSALLRHHRPLLMREGVANVSGYTLQYDDQLGLTIQKEAA